MKVWLIVPVKPFGEGKSRLAATLDNGQRAQLSRRLLNRTLSIALDSKLFAGVLVISRDPAVHGAAEEAGATAMQEPGEGLNPALDAARGQALAWGADAILVLPSDLPWVTVSDLARLLTPQPGPRAVVLAPSHDGGTNALLLCPPDAMDFAFGTESYQRHCELAERGQLPMRIVQSPTLAFDVDKPYDLHLLAESERR